MARIQLHSLFWAMCLAQPYIGTSMDDVRQQLSKLCKCCVTQVEVWKQKLKVKKHGCAVCHNVFDENCWTAGAISSHRSRRRDLVCPPCAARGYAPHKYASYHCTSCREKFGCNRFSKYMKEKARKKTKTHLFRKKDETDPIRCSKCNVAYDDACWTRNELLNYRSGKTKIVCKACRAKGFRPHNLEAYPCQECKGNFGTRRFNNAQLVRFRRKRKTHLVCTGCQTSVLRCSKCAVAYDDACWTLAERRASRRTKLVCNPCRAQGFHPRSLQAYTCQSCKGNFGYLRFSKLQRQYSEQRSFVKLVCLQCIAQETDKEATSTAQNAAAANTETNGSGNATPASSNTSGDMAMVRPILD